MGTSSKMLQKRQIEIVEEANSKLKSKSPRIRPMKEGKQNLLKKGKKTTSHNLENLFQSEETTFLTTVILTKQKAKKYLER